MSEKYTATGIIETIQEQQTRGSFTFQTFTLEIPDEKYPQFIEMQLAARNMAEIAKVKEGDTCTVSFNLRGRHWTDPKTNAVKTFNTLDCWRIEPVAGQSKSDDVPGGAPEDDGIPF